MVARCFPNTISLVYVPLFSNIWTTSTRLCWMTSTKADSPFSFLAFVSIGLCFKSSQIILEEGYGLPIVGSWRACWIKAVSPTLLVELIKPSALVNVDLFNTIFTTRTDLESMRMVFPNRSVFLKIGFRFQKQSNHFLGGFGIAH